MRSVFIYTFCGFSKNTKRADTVYISLQNTKYVKIMHVPLVNNVPLVKMQ